MPNPPEKHDALDALFDSIPARAQPSETGREQAYTELRQQWMADVAERKQKRTSRQMLAAAAAFVLVIGSTLWLPNFQSNSAWETQIASGDISIGESPSSITHLNNQHDGAIKLHPDTMMTANAISRLTLANQVDIRLDKQTQLRWISQNEVYLQAGSIYVDTHQNGQFVIQTKFGQVQDIGTRFLVSAGDDSLEVGVRDGTAELRTANELHSASGRAGTAEVLKLVASQKTGHSAGQPETTIEVTKGSEPASGTRWQWIQQVNPNYDDRTIALSLARIADDLGLALDYASAGVAAAVDTATLPTGQLPNTPRAALQSLTSAADLVYEIRNDGEFDGVIYIARKR